MARDKLDRYYTPQRLADVLVSRLLADGFVPSTGRISALEPSVGGGAFALAARSAFGERASMHVMDVDPDAPGLRLVRGGGHARDIVRVGDFGATIPTNRHDVVLGNPPYRQAELHVRKALSSLVDGGVLGMLLRLAFLEGKCRIPFWAEYPAAKLYALSERPSFTDGGTDATAYGFFVWRRGYHAKTLLEVLSWKSHAEDTTETRGAA
jgi:hypothetical protein